MKKRILQANALCILCCLMIGVAILPGKAHGWGAVTVPIERDPGFWESIHWSSPATTHQFILSKAHLRLQNDPAYYGSGFPVVNAILSYEGVKFNGAYQTVRWGMSGPGPDSEGRTQYSDHYYNPKIRQDGAGGAPDSVTEEYESLVVGLLDGNPNKSAKAASWGAHFLADMHVPYHVVGIPGEEAYADEAYLSLAESGPTCLWNPGSPDEEPSFGWGRDRSFSRAFEKYRKYSADRDYRDWLDPWYINGLRGPWGIDILTGSHASWEKAVHAEHVRHSAKNYKQIPYEPSWKNESFSRHAFIHLSTDRSLPSEKQLDQVKQYTKEAATETRNNIRPYLKEPMTPVDRAIQRVATLWRASISALKPSIRHVAISPGEREVACAVENVSKKYRAADVLVKLTVDEDIIGFKRLGELAGGETQEFAWQFEAEDSAQGMAQLEVIGTYQNLPDLGYAVVKKEIRQSELEKLLNELEEKVVAAEDLSRESQKLCSKAKYLAAEAQDAASTLREEAQQLKEQIAKLAPEVDRMGELQTRISREHKNAETATAKVEQTTSKIEGLSLQICRKAKTLANASQTRAEQLLTQIEKLGADLKILRSQSHKYADEAEAASRNAEKNAAPFAAIADRLARLGDQEDLADILMEKQQLLDKADRTLAANRKKIQQLAEKNKQARELIAEASSLLRTHDYQKNEKSYRKQLNELTGRLKRTVRNAESCQSQARKAAQNAREALGRVMEKVIAASAARKDLLRGSRATQKDADRVLEKAELAEFLAQLAHGYVEEIKNLAVDSTFCLLLARDQAEKTNYIALPDLRGQDADRARQILRQKGFTVQQKNAGQPPRQQLANKVKNQQPDPGEKIRAGATVTLDVYDQFDPQALLADVDCSKYPNTEPAYDSESGRTGCACKPFFVPDTNGPGCVDCQQLKKSFNQLLRQNRLKSAENKLARAGNCAFQEQAHADISMHRNRIIACEKRNTAILRAVRQRDTQSAYSQIREAQNYGCKVDPGVISIYNQLAQQVQRETQLHAEQRRRDDQREAFNTFIQGMTAITQNIERQRHQNRNPPTRNRGDNPLTGALPSTNPGDPLNDYSFSTSPEPSGSRHSGVSSGGQSSTTAGGTAGSGMSRSDCIKKFCPVCQPDDEITMIGVSADEQCEDCKKQYAAKIAACEKGTSTGSGNTLESFQKYYLYKCWFKKVGENYERTYHRYYMTGPGEPSLGSRKRAESNSQKSQCINCESIKGPDTWQKIWWLYYELRGWPR